ncbi:hypothetical protein WOLCODRAFT_164301 [Wolfiporia cocos MD-104 SS10]|uniref:Uncharacterized protein n=1 Tax=Wolfiporia cocos (strain MD-104) TaxID=742152 RepID=A0A2H3JLV3_WOLCO|nr:hypothetical protein WOLCODRAFT_164301 [Wolfiporia cocos MD-104 SS10]
MVFVRLPDDYHTLDNQQAASIYASFDIVPEPKDDECNPYDEFNVRGYAIHGEMSLPEGYTWATVSPEWFKKIAAQTLRSPTMLKLSRSQSWIKMAISIAQVMFGSFTLYRSRGDQIDRFGYAAYGLSVVPYVIMSIVNLFAVGLSADYPCLYAVRTSIMEEAASRPGALFDGAICTLRPNPDFQVLFDSKSAPAIPESAPSNPESIPSNPDLVSSNPGFASTEPEPSSSDSIQNSEDYESSLVGDSTYPDYNATEDDDKANLLPKAESVESNIDSNGCNHTPPGSGSPPQENPIYTAAWLSIESDTGAETQDRFLVVRTGDIVKRFKFFPGCKDGDGETRVVRLTINAITNEYVPWNEDDDDSNDAWWAVLPFVFLFVVFGLPYVIISVMTKFKTGSSSVTQRAFMLAWLCCSQAIFIPFWVLSEQDMGWMSLPSLLRNPAFFLFMAPFAVGPILGYIAVVQMYIADNSSQASLCI